MSSPKAVRPTTRNPKYHSPSSAAVPITVTFRRLNHAYETWVCKQDSNWMVSADKDGGYTYENVETAAHGVAPSAREARRRVRVAVFRARMDVVA